MLSIRSFSKSYDKKKYACKNVSLEVEAGDIYGFIGHNGAGKSTCIKAVVGILNFDEGEIYIDGVNIKENPLLCKSNTAYIPDNPDIYENLTGIQYLNFIADAFNVSSDLRKARIEKYATIFEMNTVLNDLISSYSHGMKQKIVLISALIHKPKLLVLDEPFVGLDPMAAYKLKEIMKEMCSEGSAIFFSSHVLDVVEKLCNKVAIIRKGEIIKAGLISEVRNEESLEDIFLELVENEQPR